VTYLSGKCLEENGDLYRQIMDFCYHIAGSARIAAVSYFDYCATKTAKTKSVAEVVLVIHDFPIRIMSYLKTIAGRSILLIVVDQWIFERDVERGFLGEAAAGTLVFPYVALRGENYLHEQEVKLKKRLVLELLVNLVLSFPELSTSLRIKPEYFMYEVMLNRVRVFPPLANCVSNFMQGVRPRSENNPTLKGYLDALGQLSTEEKVLLSDDIVMIPKTLVLESKTPKSRLTNISRNASRTFFTPLFQTVPQLLNIFNQNTEAFPNFQLLNQLKGSQSDRSFFDPQEYVFVPTSKGLVSLADRINVDGFVRKKLLGGENGKIKRENLGGFLNDVYLIKVESKSGKKQVLVKRFKDWSGFKWFPLNLWVLGTRTFAVLGKTRFERECATNELLSDAGFNVPKVLHVSQNERLVFMEFIEGENLISTIKRIGQSSDKNIDAKDLEKLNRVGELLRRVHSMDVALGDTKPENVIVDPNDNLYLLDFEQASQGGDKSWDIAEFLYFSGHYLPPLHSNRKAEAIATAFIIGYLKAGGNVTIIRKAGTSKYTRIFSLFTAPSVLLAMAEICRNTEPLEEITTG
jgi:tRNA A-37 threonylcarbamoyl transferase component Bud32